MKHFGLVHSGIINANLMNYEVAISRLSESLTLAETFPDEKLRQRLTSNSLIALANVQREAGNCKEAVPNYDQAVELFNNMQFAVGSYEARRGRLLCYVERRDNESVKREMPLILQLFDKYRRAIVDEGDRNILFDDEQHIYDIATEYAYSNLKNAEQAFDYAENSRARSLLNLIDSDAEQTKPLSLAEIRSRIPSGVQILYYAVLTDKILLWYISGVESQLLEIPLKQTDLEKKGLVIKNFYLIDLMMKSLVTSFTKHLNLRMTLKIRESHWENFYRI